MAAASQLDVAEICALLAIARSNPNDEVARAIPKLEALLPSSTGVTTTGDTGGSDSDLQRTTTNDSQYSVVNRGSESWTTCDTPANSPLAAAATPAALSNTVIASPSCVSSGSTGAAPASGAATASRTTTSAAANSSGTRDWQAYTTTLQLQSILPNWIRWKVGESSHVTNELCKWLVQEAQKLMNLDHYGISVSVENHFGPRGLVSLYKITPVTGLRTMARIIAENRTTIDKKFLGRIRQTVIGRSQTNGWYEEQRCVEGSEVCLDHGRHRFFIELLRRVYQMLKTLPQE